MINRGRKDRRFELDAASQRPKKKQVKDPLPSLGDLDVKVSGEKLSNGAMRGEEKVL